MSQPGIRALWCALLSASMLVSGCPKPSDARRDALAELGEMEPSGEVRDASDLPDALIHLRLAQESLDEAITLDRRGKTEKANSRLLRAGADAELAMTLVVGMSQSLAADLEEMSYVEPSE